MKMKTMKFSALVLAILMIGFTSCEKTNTTEPTTVNVVSVTDSLKVHFSSTKPYVLFRFKDSSIVANSDSATSKWDIGIRFVNIIVNSHASGPGNAGVIIQPGVYDNFSKAPEGGYAYDTTSTKLAINSNPFDANSWYSYNAATHTPFVKAGQFFVFRTADNHYVKMEILSIDYADFVSPTAPPMTLIYKFRYTFQADGSRNF